MRSVRTILLVLLGGFPCTAWCAPSLVDHKVCSISGSSCTTAAMNNTGATVLVAYNSCLDNGSVDPSVVTDSSGNTWSKLTGQTATGSNVVNGTLWYVIGPVVTSSQTVTLSMISVACTLFAASFNGTLTTGAVDQSNGATSGSNLTQSTIQPGSITPGANGELLVTGLGVYCLTNCSTPVVGIDTGFTLIDSTNANSVVDGGLAYFVQSSAAAINPTWSAGPVSAGIVSTITSFKVPAAPGGEKHRGKGIL